MEPVEFKEKNRTLSRPKHFYDECKELPVFTDGNVCISCWSGDVKTRLKFLFTGKLWLWVYSGYTQPPVWVDAGYPFNKNKKIYPGFYWKCKFCAIGFLAHVFQCDQRWIFLFRLNKGRFGYRTYGDATPDILTYYDGGWHFPWQDRSVSGRG